MSPEYQMLATQIRTRRLMGEDSEDKYQKLMTALASGYFNEHDAICAKCFSYKIKDLFANGEYEVATINVQGGTQPYTYQWRWVPGHQVEITVTDSRGTTFTQYCQMAQDVKETDVMLAADGRILARDKAIVLRLQKNCLAGKAMRAVTKEADGAVLDERMTARLHGLEFRLRFRMTSITPSSPRRNAILRQMAPSDEH